MLDPDGESLPAIHTANMCHDYSVNVGPGEDDNTFRYSHNNTTQQKQNNAQRTECGLANPMLYLAYV